MDEKVLENILGSCCIGVSCFMAGGMVLYAVVWWSFFKNWK